MLLPLLASLSLLTPPSCAVKATTYPAYWSSNGTIRTIRLTLPKGCPEAYVRLASPISGMKYPVGWVKLTPTHPVHVRSGVPYYWTAEQLGWAGQSVPIPLVGANP